MNYRIDKRALLEIMELWNGFLRKKVHFIACGGTAMTLLEVKPSTKDIDFMVPNIKEYNYLINIIKALDYKQVTGNGWKREGDKFIFDLFRGNYIHTTELLESPLVNDNHRLMKEYSHLYIGILNDYDLISSKLIRGTAIDYDDCKELVQARSSHIDIARLESHYLKLASYDVAEERVKKHIEHFIQLLRKEKIV
jgi:hypothetical protein